jgi:hypothetical protein
MRKAFIVVAFCLFGALGLSAEEGMTALRIHVTTPGGRPIDRASVIVKFVEGRSVVKLGKKVMTSWELRTNQDGMARIPPVPQGKIRVQVVAKGYQTFGEIFDISEEEKQLDVKLNPPQPQYSSHQ